MKRSLLYIVTLLLLLGTNFMANAGFQKISQLTGPAGTTTYPGGVVVTASLFSCGAYPDVTGPACVGGPSGGEYVIGIGSCPGWIEYTFTGSQTVYGIHIISANINTGEDLEVGYNAFYSGGLTPGHYAIQPSDLTGLGLNTCPGPSSGPTTIGPGTGGAPGCILGPGCCPFGASSPFNGAEFIVRDCAGMSSFTVYSNGFSGGVDFEIYFDTVRPAGCSNAIANSPCEGDTLKLGDRGDSTNPTIATYLWTGPGSFSSTEQYPFIYPSFVGQSGTYTVYKTQGFVIDTDTVVVVVHPRAFITSATSNSPICVNPADTLHLQALVPGLVPGETFMWTGPNLFTSTLQDPDIYGYVASDSGTYFVTATTPFGCSTSSSTYVVTLPPPLPPTIIGPTPYCYGDPFVPFTTTGVVPGAAVLWYTAGTGGVGSTTAPTINTSAPDTTWVFASQKLGYCESVRDSEQIVVLPQIKPSFTWDLLLGCDSNVATFFNTSTAADWYSWNYGDGGTSGDTTTSLITRHDYVTNRVFAVTLTGYIPGCHQSVTGYVNATHANNPFFTLPDSIMCAGQRTTLNDSTTTVDDSSIITQPDGGLAALKGSSATVDTGLHFTDPHAPSYLGALYAWDFGDGQTDLTNTRTPPAHHYDSGGHYTIKLTLTDSIGCVATYTQPINVLELTSTNLHDTMLCVSQDLPLHAYFKANVRLNIFENTYTYTWTPPTYLSDTSIANPYYTFKGAATTTYTITVAQPQYGCYTTDTMRIQSVLGVKLANLTSDATILYGRSIQLNADSEVYYYWRRDNGTLNDPNISNPVATPLVTTMYTVFGYDKNGCVDSANINIVVDSSMIENIPTGFTPNGDGLNDVFRPIGIKFQTMVDFRVYNRLGQQVFYSNNYKQGWDGTFNGQPQDMDTYFYVIIVARPGGDGENVIYKGSVTLIR